MEVRHEKKSKVLQQKRGSYVKKGYRLVAIPFQKRHENTNAIAHKKVYVCKHEPHMEWNGITMMSYIHLQASQQ